MHCIYRSLEHLLVIFAFLFSESHTLHRGFLRGIALLLPSILIKYRKLQSFIIILGYKTSFTSPFSGNNREATSRKSTASTLDMKQTAFDTTYNQKNNSTTQMTQVVDIAKEKEGEKGEQPPKESMSASSHSSGTPSSSSSENSV